MNAQGFYEHLHDCVLRLVQRGDLSEAVDSESRGMGWDRIHGALSCKALLETLLKHSFAHIARICSLVRSVLTAVFFKPYNRRSLQRPTIIKHLGSVRRMLKLYRTMMGGYVDEMYNPSFQIASVPTTSILALTMNDKLITFC